MSTKTMSMTSDELQYFFETVLPHLDDDQIRLVIGGIVAASADDGVQEVADATAMSTADVADALAYFKAQQSEL